MKTHSGCFFAHLFLGEADVQMPEVDRYSDGRLVVHIGELSISSPGGDLAVVLRRLADRVDEFERANPPRRRRRVG